MVRIIAAADMQVPLERASDLITDPTLVAQWLTNSSGVRADKEWPRRNSQISWELGVRHDDVCEARVVDNSLPAYLKIEVTTPATRKIVTHNFTPLPNGGTHYEKVVDAEPKGFAKFLGPFALKRIRAEVQSEVDRAAKVVASQLESVQAATQTRQATKR